MAAETVEVAGRCLCTMAGDAVGGSSVAAPAFHLRRCLALAWSLGEPRYTYVSFSGFALGLVGRGGFLLRRLEYGAALLLAGTRVDRDGAPRLGCYALGFLGYPARHPRTWTAGHPIERLTFAISQNYPYSLQEEDEK